MASPSTTDSALAGRPALVGGPDLLFRLVFGVYAAVSTVGPVLVGFDALLRPDAGVAYLAGLAWLTVATVAVAVGLRRAGELLPMVGTSPAGWSLPVAPALLQALVVVTLAVGWGGLTDSGWLLVTLAGAAGVVLGLLLLVMARTRVVRARVADEETLAEWRAGWPRRERTWLRRLATASVALGVLSMAAGFWYRVGLFVYVGQFAIPVGAVAAVRTEPVRYRATAVGIEEIGPVYRRLYAWEALSEYTVDAERIVVGRRRPWRPALRWNRTEIEDVTALRRALSANLRP